MPRIPPERHKSMLFVPLRCEYIHQEVAMHPLRLKSWRILTLTSFLFLLFTVSVPQASASTGGSGNTGGSVSDSHSHPSATIKNPKAKQHNLSATPNSASACNALISAYKNGTLMEGDLTVTCIGGTAYWVTNFMYSEHCRQSIAGWCWAGWDNTNSYPECDAHYITTLRCPSSGNYLREAASGQLWRWRAETCAQFDPGGLSVCTEEDYQLQF